MPTGGPNYPDKLTAGWSKAEKAWAEAHHDLLFARADWFAAHGLDVNDPRFGRWVVGRRGKDAFPNRKLHQDWHKEFNDAWEEFIGKEKLKSPYTREQVLAKMQELADRFKARGIPR